jgi:biotin operon repressor
MTGVTTTHGDKQRNALMLFMHAFSKQKHYLPTIADMASGLGMQRTAVVWHLEMLRDEGRVDYVDGHMARSLKILSR